ncbi:MAG: penicillin-binding transpeptidase domain-containing protein [Egicoccus sp.]
MRRALLAVAALALVAAATGWWWWTNRDPGPVPAAEAFVAAWNDGDLAGGPFDTAPATVREQYTALTSGLVEGAGAEGPTVALTSVSEPVEGRSTAEYTVTWTLADGQPWRYAAAADLMRVEEGWRFSFAPGLVHPDLTDDLRLATTRTRPQRGDLLAADGTPLVTDRPVVDVGVHPALVDDVDALAATLRDVLDISADGLEERITSVDPDQFVPVITLREPAWDDVEARLRDVAGVVGRRGQLPLAPTAEFARPLLGRTGPVTAELVEEYPERYAAGDTAGLSGLLRRYDEHLAGRPGMQIVATPVDGAADDTSTTVLHERRAVDGDPVRITLDERIQRAADTTLAGVAFPSALVAIRVSDGHVVAVANGPGTDGLDVATRGRYAPGSTFKVVTTAALLAQGLEPDEAVGCPAEAVVDGRAFTNAEDGARGQIPFHEAFAQSCNTTFVSLAADLGPETLATTGADFGLGGAHTLGVDAFTGEVPTTEAGTDQAAAAIGQGRILVSPLAMADVAATVARRAHLPPSLVLAPRPGDATAETPLDPEIAATLQQLMRDVVTDGSGGAVADVPGAPVHGKTGTAEYGTTTPPRTHAWFIGFQDDLAFAVLVAETEDSYGGRVAAPLAADFLQRLTD